MWVVPTTTSPNEAGDSRRDCNMLTKAQIAEATFGGTSIRPYVKYEYTDITEGDMWLVSCTGCFGNGYDIDVVDDYKVCTVCDGLGEFGPMNETEVREHLA